MAIEPKFIFKVVLKELLPSIAIILSSIDLSNIIRIIRFLLIIISFNFIIIKAEVMAVRKVDFRLILD